MDDRVSASPLFAWRSLSPPRAFPFRLSFVCAFFQWRYGQERCAVGAYFGSDWTIDDNDSVVFCVWWQFSGRSNSGSGWFVVRQKKNCLVSLCLSVVVGCSRHRAFFFCFGGGGSSNNNNNNKIHVCLFAWGGEYARGRAGDYYY